MSASEGDTPAAAQEQGGEAEDSTLEVARRIYLYVIAAVGLTLLGIGLSNLLELAFSQLDEDWRDANLLVGGAGDIRRQVSAHVAMLLVALPIWMIHWYFAERAVARDDSERRSTVRSSASSPRCAIWCTGSCSN
jgi:hypothetical protein